MYGSPTFNDMNRGDGMESTVSRITHMYKRLDSHIRLLGCEPKLLKDTLNEMKLPDKSDVNICFELNAAGLLFLAAMKDLADKNLLTSGFNDEDIVSANEFRSSIVEKLNSISTTDKRTLYFYDRDLVPLIGNTVKTQLLVQ
jgi:hypothetical protein